MMGRVLVWVALAALGIYFLIAGVTADGGAVAVILGVLCVGGAMMVRASNSGK